MRRVWEPDPAWQPLAGGASGARLWRVPGDPGGVVKRLVRPEPGEDTLRERPSHPGFWRREAEVAQAPAFVAGPGLVPPTYRLLEDDDEGVTLWVEEVAGEPPTGLLVARCLGEFATAAYDAPAWASRQLLRRRVELVAERGGWRTLERTPLADVTDVLWRRREHWLDRLDTLPQGRVHGDATPGNFLAVREGAVVATDWQCAGVGPVGADLGYWSLSAREEVDVLVDTFCAGTGAERDDVALAARVSAVYSVLTRAEWALAQAAPGEGALAGKFRHSSVAPYLRAVQRQFPQIERLLGDG